MGLTGKMVKEIEIKAGGDVIHQLFCKNQTDVAQITPGKIHGCDLHHGQRGDHGSIVCWDYTHEGKRKKSKQLVEPDYENNTTKLTMLEGDLLDLYKTFVVTLKVEKHGENDSVTWTAEYEKLNENVEDPASLMEFLEEMTKDIEAHHLPKPAEAEAEAEAKANVETKKGLIGKMVKQIEIKAGGDVIHELYCKNQTGVSEITPGKVHGCDLHHGKRGDHGSIICWDYTHVQWLMMFGNRTDGKRQKAKQHVEPDYKNNTTKFTMLEGDLMELYKTFVITLSVENHGEKDLVTWTTEYEKKNEYVEDPASLMDFFAEMTKDIEDHHLPKPAEAEAKAEACVEAVASA